MVISQIRRGYQHFDEGCDKIILVSTVSISGKLLEEESGQRDDGWRDEWMDGWMEAGVD